MLAAQTKLAQQAQFASLVPAEQPAHKANARQHGSKPTAGSGPHTKAQQAALCVWAAGFQQKNNLHENYLFSIIHFTFVTPAKCSNRV
jgi:hypothetical protein